MAFEVHEKWPALLERFTTASEAEIALDEPLLVLRRNVQLTVHRELAVYAMPWDAAYKECLARG